MTTDNTAVDVETLKAQKEAHEAAVKDPYKEHTAKRAKEGGTGATKKEKKKAAKKNAKAKKAATKGKVKGGGIKALETAKVRYKEEHGDASTCGDWLAVTLRDAFLIREDGDKGRKVLDVEGFLKCCKENGLDTKEPWATNRSPGWQGRMRMNGRQKLEIVVAREGHLVMDGKKVKPTGVFLKTMVKRHPEEEEKTED